MSVKLSPDNVTIKISDEATPEPAFIEVEGIQEIELSTEKGEFEARTLHDLWQKNETISMGINISIGGYMAGADATGAETGTPGPGLAQLITAMHSEDDVKEFEIASYSFSATQKFRVSEASESLEFANQVDWAATLQSYDSPTVV